MIKTLFQLFLAFAKIGFTSFGGTSMIPLIMEEMLSHNWMKAEDVANIVAIAEMTPGSLGVNCATFAGIRTAGLPGAVFANLGVLAPSLTLCVLAAVFFARVKDSERMQQMMVGVRPVCFGLICAVMVELSKNNYQVGAASVPAVFIGVADAVLLLRFHWSVPKVLLLSAGLGLLLVR